MPDCGLRLAFVALASALILPRNATAQEQKDPIKPLQEQIELSRRRLNEIREERKRLDSEMRALSAQVHDVRAELENLNELARNQGALLRELDNQLAIRDQQVNATTSELLRTQDELVEKKVLFARRARDLYKRGPLAQVKILLTAESFSELINRYQYLYLVALHDRLLVRQIEELQGLLEGKYEQLRREVQGLRDVRTEKYREVQELYSLEQERERRLRSVRGRQASTERRMAELERGETDLTELIDRLEREREAAEALAASTPTRGTLTAAERGKLDWPVEGRVIYRFGREQNRDGTSILRNGIGIAAPEGTPVKAVAGGTVAFAEGWYGYGPSVIITHGGGYYSLYLQLSEISVVQGENVVLGQVIGRVGGSGTPEGSHIQFQIRADRRAIDPLPWLKKRGG
jgi:septal ring factor EnvC (AmiA/AmiB activator)